MGKFYGGWAFLVWFALYLLGFVIFAALNPNIPGGCGWTWTNPHAVAGFFLLMALPGFFPGFLVIASVAHAILESYAKRHPSAGLLAFRRTLSLHKLYVAAERETKQAAYEAEQAILRKKRSYWEFLDGYAICLVMFT